jgi:carboxypeptidase PM20D1
MIRPIPLALAGLALGLVAIVAIRTVLVGAPSRAGADTEAAPITVDAGMAAERLARAIRFQTVSSGAGVPPDMAALRDLRDFLAEAFPRAHGTLAREVVGDHSLLFTWPGANQTADPILLAAHMDVVPAEDGAESAWVHPPFSGDIADGFVWGRGTLDDKASVLGILEAVEHLLGEGFVPARTVYLAFGHDEEIGGGEGAGAIAARLAQRGVRLAFVLDEGSIIAERLVPGVAPPAALIGLAEKGFLTVRLVAAGEGGHSSMPPPERSAVGRLAEALVRLERDPMPADLRPPASAMLDALAPYMPVSLRVAVANRWLFQPFLVRRLEGSAAGNAMVRTTTAATVLSAGSKENVLPAEATAHVNFRLLPGDTVEAVLRHVETALKGLGVRVEPDLRTAREPSAVSDAGAEGYGAIATSIRQVFPDAVVAPALVVAGTDSRHYARISQDIYRFLPVRLGPEDLARIHGANERITVDGYADLIRFYVQLLRTAAADGQLQSGP